MKISQNSNFLILQNQLVSKDRDTMLLDSKFYLPW